MAPKKPCFCVAKGRQIQVCDFTKHDTSKKCCWCQDKRTSDEIIVYIDGIGDVNPTKLGIKYPKDIGYCPKCKKVKISSAELYNRIYGLYKSRKSSDEEK